ncbi:MAG: 50S ribosomal protein L3 N(5)-glutamine methyltransferase [Candidatus Thiosymbion ectosymbiont of Robbea hypermnestra]|nr:50S ribosomal protein L3 N(5)-glutamine methyltransferase [Candidatus Thiosymbion ectosymbiont of Robbea hypermnestra]
MANPPEELLTLQDFIRWGASRFNAEGLFFGHGTDNALDEASQLVLHALHLPPDLPATFRECRLTFPEREAVRDLLDRRIDERKPAAYLTHRAWFAGLEFSVNQDVLVPRSPLAELVEAGFDPWVEPEGIHRILDLCTGSGCIGIACAVHVPEADVDLADISLAALEVASTNLARHHLEDRVRTLRSDLFEAVGDRHYDVIVSNPPYVSTAELATLPEEYRKEPRLGLAGGTTGLDLVLRILRDAPAYLEADGALVMEVGSAAPELERRFPDVPFSWLEFDRGGEGVFLLSRGQLLEFNALFEKELGRL